MNDDQRSPDTRRPVWLAFAAVAWAVTMSVPLVLLAAAHQSPIQAVAVRGEALAVQPSNGSSDLAAQTPSKDRWRLTHVLVEGCPCSKSIADHLLARGRSVDADETVIIAEGGYPQPWVEQLSSAGFDVRRLSDEDVTRTTGVNGGPWLLIADASGTQRYQGGYLDGRPGARGERQAPADLDLLHKLRAGETVVPFKALGCGVGQSLIQPFGGAAAIPAKETNP